MVYDWKLDEYMFKGQEEQEVFCCDKTDKVLKQTVRQVGVYTGIQCNNF